MFGPPPSGQLMICSVHHQYSSSVSPFHAKTGTPAAAIAAAAWSWVEKMLHEAQRSSAPSAASVSMSTAVWIVMCSDPAMRAPASGCDFANSSRTDMRPGISVSAIAISRPEVGLADVGHAVVLELGVDHGIHGHFSPLRARAPLPFASLEPGGQCPLQRSSGDTGTVTF